MKELFFNKGIWYFIAFAYIYIMTMSSMSAVNALSAGRISYLLATILFGFYAIKGTKSHSIQIISSTIYLTLYMVFVALAEFQNVSSFLSTTINFVIWVVVLYQVCRMDIGTKQMNMIGVLMATTCNILAFLFISIQSLISFEQSQEMRVAMVNSVYYVFGFVPFVFLIRKWYISVMFLILPTFVFAIANKTTCLLCCAIFILYFIVINIKNQGWTTKMGVTLAAIVGLYLLNANVDITEIVQGVDEDFASGGNGRTKIADQILTLLINEENPFLLLLGHGTNSVVSAIGIGGHNDFLEILYCYGLFGIILLVKLYITLIKTASSKIIQVPTTRIAYIISLIVFSFMVFASKVFGTQLGMIPFALIWGVVLANTRYNKEIIN